MIIPGKERDLEDAHRNEGVIGYCDDCGYPLYRGADKVPDHDIWECSRCGHPNGIGDIVNYEG